MQHLRDLEVLEIEVLDKLNSLKILDLLYFGGGTMLRLCHNLNRYSTDLDFWMDSESDSKVIYEKINKVLNENFQVIDSYNKRNTLLFEFRSVIVGRNLKIEIRKEQKDFEWERKIAFSRYSTKQVMIQGLTLEQMMKNKTAALLSRKIIRDSFDIEFLLLRGVELNAEKENLEEMLEIINSFKDKDYKVGLGSVLEQKERDYYIINRFRFLKEEITNKLLKR